MNALNEVNKVIASVTYYPHRHSGIEQEEEWLTSERMAKWIKENNVLEIVLRDSLHQPQYVEKLEKILRFIIKERTLSLEDLDAVWAAQCGKHEAIVKNVHDLLAKLAWDFSPEQLDHLFECFQASWTNANKKQREKLLELIRRLAEDDKDGVMAHKYNKATYSTDTAAHQLNGRRNSAVTLSTRPLDFDLSVCNLGVSTQQGSLLAGLYLLVEPTTGHNKNRCAISIWAMLWMSSSGTSLTANVEILGFMGNSIVGGVCSLTSEVLVNLNKGVPPPAYFDWRGWFRAGLPFFRDDFEM
ncbi:putative ubiquitin carboxyl-terminal hydrolase FAF-X [Homalodisca vitripennis]|nr:putative ubiquitin carboxyl-terminal hydrolase FAF-X [Homalodisca vitripennis]